MNDDGRDQRERGKRFPLSLDSFGDKRERVVARGRAAVATPQTATRNAARTAPPARVAALTSAGPPERRAINSGAFVKAREAPAVSASVRRAMVARVASQGVRDSKVLSAMEAVQRHLFLEDGMVAQAYVDASIPIGYQQTISQPYIVARMIEVLRNGASLQRVLEIGTGCGYQAAVLSLLAQEVYSIERIRPLHELAKTNLRPMRIPNIRLHYGDGMLGLPQAAPFDGIILAAAGIEVPQTLLDQMSIGGRLVAPVGARHQVLQLIERVGQHDWRNTTLEDCHFVPLRAGIV